MVDQIRRQAATHTKSPVSSGGLSIKESEDLYLWSAQVNRKHDLSALAENAFGAASRFGEMLGNNSLRLLRLWPHQAYLLHTQPELPDSTSEYASMLTDISHGFCELRVSGDQAIEFLGSYSSVNLTAPQITESRNLRCLLGQYQVILWWEQPDDVRILIERSYAQSFCDYLEQLMQRWS